MADIDKPKRHAPHKAQPLAAADNPDALLQITLAAVLMGGGVSTVYHRARNDPSFPKLIKIGKRCTRIRAGDLTQWLQQQAQVAA